MWRLIDDIKEARRMFEQEDADKFLADLQRRLERSGNAWSQVLRTETLLLLAEEERAKICRSRGDGNKVDLTRLKELLKELGDV